MKIVPIGLPIVKKIPAWKNRRVIDTVKDDIVRIHNKKIREGITDSKGE